MQVAADSRCCGFGCYEFVTIVTCTRESSPSSGFFFLHLRPLLPGGTWEVSVDLSGVPRDDPKCGPTFALRRDGGAACLSSPG